MSFSSFGEFLGMGGHALYVWLSYGAAMAVLLYNVLAARSQQRRALQDVRDRMRREAGGAGGTAAALPVADGAERPGGAGRGDEVR